VFQTFFSSNFGYHGSGHIIVDSALSQETHIFHPAKISNQSQARFKNYSVP
jgi:hypothetical protein